MKVYITGDFLRPEIIDGVAVPHQRGNFRWFSSLIGPTLKAAVGHDVFLWFPEDRVLGSPGEWAAMYEEMGNDSCPNADLVVGFEMSPGFRDILDVFGVSWVNLSLHPARYMMDILFDVTASADIFGHLIQWEVRPAEFTIGAGLVRAKLSWLPDLGLGDFSLFTGQTWQDASLIHDGRFWGPADALPLLGDGPPVLFKPHPHEKSETATFGRITNENVYRLMCQPGCQEVISLSSSTLFEAEQFGLPARRLMPPKKDEGKIPVWGDDVVSPYFWDCLLSLGEMSEPTIPHIANLIRNTLPHRWGDDILFK